MQQGRTRLLPALLSALTLALAASTAAAQTSKSERLSEADDAAHILKEAADEPAAAAAVEGGRAERAGASLSIAEARPFTEFLEGEGPAPQSQGSARTYTPLTPGQKMRRAFKSAFLDPTAYAVAAFTAGLTQLGEDDLPHKDTEDKVADWGSRTARNYGRLATRRIFVGGVYPVIFKQDPRYERSPKKGFGSRTLHAISRVFVTRGDNGNLQPNWSRFAGTATAHGLANLWEHSTPGHDRVGWDATLRRIPRSFLFDALNNIVFKEFLPDLF